MNTFLESLLLINWQAVAIMILVYCLAATAFAYAVTKSNEPIVVKRLNIIITIALGCFILMRMWHEDVFPLLTNAHAAALSLIIVAVCYATFLLLQFFSSLAWNCHAEIINRKLDEQDKE